MFIQQTAGEITQDSAGDNDAVGDQNHHERAVSVLHEKFGDLYKRGFFLVEPDKHKDHDKGNADDQRCEIHLIGKRYVNE